MAANSGSLGFVSQTRARRSGVSTKLSSGTWQVAHDRPLVPGKASAKSGSTLLGCLGDLLRDSLEGRDEMQTLDNEITWLRRYAEILASRHGDAVRFDWDIPPETGGVLLPRLLLQPLVENAVQHGALCRAGGGRVSVFAQLRLSSDGAASRLVCTVMDNGPGLAASEPRAGAVGLHTVRRRLELRCPGSAFRLQSSNEGTSAIVEVPITPEVAA